jgi:hypothetical protein
MVVWKYPIGLVPIVELMIPTPPDDLGADPEILSVQLQGGEPVLWALVDPTLPQAPHRFVWLPTGGPPVHEDMLGEYVGTIQLPDGLVFHLFELAEG